MAVSENDINQVALKYEAIKECLSEKGRRLWAAVEANSYGWGGAKLVATATGISASTIYRGTQEINGHNDKGSGIRRKGGGRKPHAITQPGLTSSLDALVDPHSKGDPESSLRWTSKSTRKLAQSLQEQGYQVSRTTVGILLHDLGYTLQANKKTLEDSNHPDRDDQFNYINDRVTAANAVGQPAISIDTKKKEKIGNFYNNGREYAEKGKPIEVNGHDFVDKKLGKAIPYGIYDIGSNTGWVSVGISADTAQFAVHAIRTWWLSHGALKYASAVELLITADCGGSNSYRAKLWKLELQRLANEINLQIQVHHFPPGTSKWNKIEHRLFSYISKNWRGTPLVDHETVVNLIGNTTTTKGLTVAAVLDKNIYQTGIKVSKKEMALIDCKGDKFHPEWNYKIRPNIMQNQSVNS